MGGDETNNPKYIYVYKYMYDIELVYMLSGEKASVFPPIDDSVFISDGGSLLREGGNCQPIGMRVTCRCYGYCRQSNGRHPLRLSNHSYSGVFLFHIK